MFHIDPILWLQSWSSPTLTWVMNVVSLLGYTRAYVAMTMALGFAYRLRPALALLLLLALSAVLTDTAKTVTALPRPDRLDRTVQALGVPLPSTHAPRGGVDEDTYGFPSGHVSATVTFLLGLMLLFGWKKTAWVGLAVWLPLMAVSRMYLGRHFAGDLFGGAVVGLITVMIGLGIFKLDAIERPSRHDTFDPALAVLVTSMVLGIVALTVGVPDASDLGRLFGIACAAVVVSRVDVPEDPLSRSDRALLVLLAMAGFAAAWTATTMLLQATGWERLAAARVIATAFQMAATLLIPMRAMRKMVRLRA
jgi:membrane-associated phospholipid phosphatase